MLCKLLALKAQIDKEILVQSCIRSLNKLKPIVKQYDGLRISSQLDDCIDFVRAKNFSAVNALVEDFILEIFPDDDQITVATPFTQQGYDLLKRVYILLGGDYAKFKQRYSLYFSTKVKVGSDVYTFKEVQTGYNVFKGAEFNCFIPYSETENGEFAEEFRLVLRQLPDYQYP